MILSILRFFADRAAKKWPLRGSLKRWVGPYNLPFMMDRLSTLYQDLLSGSYDCVDRIVLNAYFRMGHDPGGFRVWWRALTGSDETLENARLMRLAGRFRRAFSRLCQGARHSRDRLFGRAAQA